MASIRIVRIPPGEAPEEIRKAWVGLVLPLAEDELERRKRRGFGVLSGPKNILGYLVSFVLGKGIQYDGYAVKVMDAVMILAKSNPTAAQWWRKNASHLFTPTALFLFEAGACEEIISETSPTLSTNAGTVALNCTNCGGQLVPPQGSNHVTCEYCGTTILIR